MEAWVETRDHVKERYQLSARPSPDRFAQGLVIRKKLGFWVAEYYVGADRVCCRSGSTPEIALGSLLLRLRNADGDEFWSDRLNCLEAMAALGEPR